MQQFSGDSCGDLRQRTTPCGLPSLIAAVVGPVLTYCTDSSHEALSQASFTASLRCAARTRPPSTFLHPSTSPSIIPQPSSSSSSLTMSKPTTTTPTSKTELNHRKRKLDERSNSMEPECIDTDPDPLAIFEDPVSEGDNTHSVVYPSTPPALQSALDSTSPCASVVDSDYESTVSEYSLPPPHSSTDAEHLQACNCSGYYCYSSDVLETQSTEPDDDDSNSSDLPEPSLDDDDSSELSSPPPLSDDALPIENGGDGVAVPLSSSSELSDLSSETERLIEAEDVLVRASSPAISSPLVSSPPPIVLPNTPSAATKRKAVIAYGPGNRILYGAKRQRLASGGRNGD